MMAAMMLPSLAPMTATVAATRPDAIRARGSDRGRLSARLGRGRRVAYGMLELARRARARPRVASGRPLVRGGHARGGRGL